MVDTILLLLLVLLLLIIIIIIIMGYDTNNNGLNIYIYIMVNNYSTLFVLIGVLLTHTPCFRSPGFLEGQVATGIA